jgi:WD40 repeat protein
MLSRLRWQVAALLVAATFLVEVPSQENGTARLDSYGDPLPPGALARLGTTRWRLGERNAAVAFTRAGKVLLVSGRSDGTVVLWDVASRKQQGVFSFKTDSVPEDNVPVPRPSFAPDGNTVFIRAGGELAAWELPSGRKRYFEGKRNEVIEHLAVAPRGGLVAGACVRDVAPGWQVEAVSVWNSATGKVVSRLATAAVAPWVRALAFSPDGQRLVCGGNDGAAWILDPTKGSKLHQLKAAGEGISCLAFSPASGALILGSFQGNLLAWDPATGKERRRWRAHGQGGVSAVAFSHDGKTLASAGRDGVIRIWEPSTGKDVRRLRESTFGVEALCFSPDGKTLAASGNGFPVQILDVATGKETPWLPAHRSEVVCVAYSPDGKMLATGGREPTVRLWDSTTGKPLPALEGGAGEVLELAFPPGGKALVAAGENPATVRRWDLPTRGLAQQRRPPEDDTARAVGLLADGQAVWWASRQKGEVFLQDVKSGVKVLTLERAAGNEQPWVAAHDGKTLAAAVNGNTLYLWDGTTGRRHVPGWVFEGRIMGLAFSPDDRFLAVASEGEQSLLHICELASGKNRGQPILCPERVILIAYAPDGRTLVTVSGDRQIRVWDVATRQQRAYFKGHEADVRCAAVSPDGRTLATGSADATVLVWDLTGGIKGVGVGLPSLWDELASASAEKAHRAVWGMVGHGDQAVAFVRERVQPVVLPTPEALARLVAEVGSGRLAVRERAAAELEKVGELAGPALRVALEKPLPLEVRRRLEKLIAEPVSANRLRELRAVEVLERLGTVEARQMLRGLAAGTPEVRLTREAREALTRLGKR